MTMLNTSDEELEIFGDARPDPVATMERDHRAQVDAECAAYLAAHGDEMRAELAAAAATWHRRETSAAVARSGGA